MKLEVHLQDVSGKKTRVVELQREGERFQVAIDGQPVQADAIEISTNTISVILDGQSFVIHVTPSLDGKLKLQCGPHEFSADIIDPRVWRGRKQGALEVEGRQQIVAPMPGKVIRLLVAAGDTVEAGQGLIVVEAMKMQNEIKSPKSGTLERFLAKEGQTVNAGDILAWVE